LARIPLAGEAGKAGPAGNTILTLSDALRGELYAGCWRLEHATVTRVGQPPRAMTPEQLATFGRVDRVLGTIPDALVDRVHAATGIDPVVGDAALPDARNLIALLEWQGGAARVDDPSR